MRIECTSGPVTTEVMGTKYRFEQQADGRFIADVDPPKHIAVFLAVIDHYRDADAGEPGEPIEPDPPLQAEHPIVEVTEITGIGPAMQAKLAEVGITDASQIAALTEEEAQALDDELALGGRIARDEWIEQAKALTG